MSGWRVLRVDYHDTEGQRGLLLGPVRQVVERLPAFFVRDWLRGPHIQVCLAASTDTREVTWATGVLKIWLAAHPSAGNRDEALTRRTHAALARLEHREGPTEPWLADSTVTEQDYDDRRAVLGSAAAAEDQAAWHRATTGLALDLLARATKPMNDWHALVELLCLTAVTGWPPLDRGVLSYRSHAAAFLANCRRSEAVTAEFDVAYAERAAVVRAVVADVAAGRLSPQGLRWQRLLEADRSALARTLAAGDLRLPSMGSAGTGRMSDFHRVLYERRDDLRAVGETAGFVLYRALLNHQYAFLARLGVTPRERHLLCYLADRGVQDVYGATELVPRLSGGRR